MHGRGVILNDGMMNNVIRARTLVTAASLSLLGLGTTSCSSVESSLYEGVWLFDFNPSDEDVDNADCVVDTSGNFDCLLTWGSGDPAQAVGYIAQGTTDGTLRLDQAGVEVKSYTITGDCPTFNKCEGDLYLGEEKSGVFTMTRSGDE